MQKKSRYGGTILTFKDGDSSIRNEDRREISIEHGYKCDFKALWIYAPTTHLYLRKESARKLLKVLTRFIAGKGI